jgi:hypothetical protein
MIIPPPDTTNLPSRTDSLIAFARAQQVPCLDLRSIIEAAERGGALLSYPKDGHWNAKGHQLVADALSRFIPTVIAERSLSELDPDGRL